MVDDREKVLIEKQAKIERIKRAARELAEKDRPAPEITLLKASEVPDEPLHTVFGGRLVKGSFQLVVGPGEVGKGFSAVDMIARLSTGEPFPDEKQDWRPAMTVALCVTEDSAGRVKARLMAANADLKKVIFAKGPPVMRGGLIVPSPIAFDDDAGALLDKIKSVGAGALFLETTLEHLGGRDRRNQQWSTNNEAEVRRALAPIVAVCREGGIIGWGVMHPRKSIDGGIEDSISGSAAFRNVGRTVMHVFRDPKDEEKNPWRLLVTSKANYLKQRPSTLRFRIEPWDKNPDEGHVVWGIRGRTLVDSRTAEEIWQQIREKNQKRRDYAVRDAENILTKALAGGVILSLGDIKKLGEEEDISWRSIEKAKANLGIESVKEGYPAQVVGWRLPPKPEGDM